MYLDGQETAVRRWHPWHSVADSPNDVAGSGVSIRIDGSWYLRSNRPKTIGAWSNRPLMLINRPGFYQTYQLHVAIFVQTTTANRALERTLDLEWSQRWKSRGSVNKLSVIGRQQRIKTFHRDSGHGLIASVFINLQTASSSPSTVPMAVHLRVLPARRKLW